MAFLNLEEVVHENRLSLSLSRAVPLTFLGALCKVDGSDIVEEENLFGGHWPFS